MTVQRQTAASRLTRPSRRLQQGSVGGDPTTTFLTNLRASAQTPNLRASLGHFPTDGLGIGFGLGLGLGHVSQELTRLKKRMLMDKKRANTALFLEPIFGSRRKGSKT